ncbi:MAG: hypothetical protein M3O30_05040 [Planctomycetota bacterium]|nr:hypothetical protein [Planctomycetota bacterium]
MKRWLFSWTFTLCAAAGLIGLSLGCERTIREPGETVHGGLFLHADAPAPAAEPTTR